MDNRISFGDKDRIDEQIYLNNRDYLCDQLAYVELITKINIAEKYEDCYKKIEQLRPWLSTEETDILKAKRDKLLYIIEQRKNSSIKNNIYLPLEYLSWSFNFSNFEKLCVIFCFAVEVDDRYGSILGFLQNDISLKKPWIGFLLQLFCSTQEERIQAIKYFGAGSNLSRYLFQLQDNPSYAFTPLAQQTIKLRNRIFEYILGMNVINDLIKPALKFYIPAGNFYSFSNNQDAYGKIQAFLDTHLNRLIESENNMIFYLYGPKGAGKKACAGAVCSYIKAPMLILDMKLFKDCKASLDELIKEIDIELFLNHAILCIENFDIVLDNENYELYTKIITELVLKTSRLTFLIGEKPWNPGTIIEQHIFIDICFKQPSETEKKRMWEAFAKDYAFEESIALSHFACKFNFTPGQILSVLERAKNISLWEKTENGKITPRVLTAACHAQSEGKLSAVAQKIDPRYTWKDIILPLDQKTQLNEICCQVKYRSIVFGDWGFGQKLPRGKGLNIMFSGPSGTGKTMAAEVISNELGLELYRIDLSQVVSKYIGETEKNIGYIFDEAHKSNAILFFDEADALFGKRSEVKDAHDRYANIETSYLLQKMEEYSGITILATNFRGNLDEAFSRRMSFSIEFTLPDEECRRKIWESMFTEKVPKSSDINFDFLAREFKITGGNIKNIVLTAAFYAAEDVSGISMEHIIRAVKREYQKVGRLCTRSDFGQYYDFAK